MNNSNCIICEHGHDFCHLGVACDHPKHIKGYHPNTGEFIPDMDKSNQILEYMKNKNCPYYKNDENKKEYEGINVYN